MTRLFLSADDGSWNDLGEISHIDGDPTNNSLPNLQIRVTAPYRLLLVLAVVYAWEYRS